MRPSSSIATWLSALARVATAWRRSSYLSEQASSTPVRCSILFLFETAKSKLSGLLECAVQAMPVVPFRNHCWESSPVTMSGFVIACRRGDPLAYMTWGSPLHHPRITDWARRPVSGLADPLYGRPANAALKWLHAPF